MFAELCFVDEVSETLREAKARQRGTECDRYESFAFSMSAVSKQVIKPRAEPS